MPRIIPDPRYFSMPSIVVGAEVRIKRGLNCWPWVRSLIHSPAAVTHSPGEMVAACRRCHDNERWAGGGGGSVRTSCGGDGGSPLRCRFGSEYPQGRPRDEMALKVERVVN